MTEARPDDQVVTYPGKLADICLGGCFVSTVSPLPTGTAVTVLFHPPEFAPQSFALTNGNGVPAQNGNGLSGLRPGTAAIITSIIGRTVTSVPGNGMGIEFTAVDNESSARLKALIHLLENGAASATPADVRHAL